MVSVDIVAVVLVMAALIGGLNDRFLRLPAPIGMLLGSLAAALLLVTADVTLHLRVLGWVRALLAAADLPRIFLDWVLALLLFAGSLHVDLAGLRQNRRIIGVLATFGVILSTLVFGVGLWGLVVLAGIEIPPVWCFVAGAILAPTDAVVVEALLGRTALPLPVRAAITGESLFNDGAGVVLFLVTLRMTQGEAGLIGHGGVGLTLAGQLVGGAALGCVAGALAVWVLRRLTDDAVRVIVSLALVVGAYRLADFVDVSGPVAVVCAGLLFGTAMRTRGATESGTVDHAAADAPILAFWTLLDRVLNLGLFLSIGLQVLGLTVTGRELVFAAIAVPLALLARLVSVAVPLALSGRTSRTLARQATVLTWAGMRGGISIALALTLPITPYREAMMVICYAVVLFSIVVQGLTLPGLLRRLYAASGPSPTAAGSSV
jgi:CPA1 family monovalent cation:H+ antiporter